MAKSNVFRGNFGAAAPKGKISAKVPSVVTGSVVNKPTLAPPPPPPPPPAPKAQVFTPPPPAPKAQAYIAPPTSSHFGPSTPPAEGSVVQVVEVKGKTPVQEVAAPRGEVKAPTPAPAPAKEPAQEWKEKPSPQQQTSPVERGEDTSTGKPIIIGQSSQPTQPDPYFITTEAIPPKQTSQTQTPATATGGGPNFVLPKTTGAKDAGGLRNTGVQTLAQKTPEEMKGLLFPAIGGAGVGYFAWKHGGLSPVVSAILALVAYVGVDFALKMKPRR